MESWEVERHVGAIRCRDLESVADCFAREGVLVVHGGRPYHGRIGILEFLTASRKTRVQSGQGLAIRHHVSSLAVRFESSDRAEGSAYFLAIGPVGAGHWGTYRDEFVVEDGAWRLASRTVTIDGADPAGWIGSGSGAVSFVPAG